MKNRKYRLALSLMFLAILLVACGSSVNPESTLR